MKLIKTIGLIALMAMAMPVQAQFTSGAGTPANGDINPYNRLSISYNNTGVSANKKAGDYDFSLNGVGLEYAHGFALSSAHPLYLELGVKLRYSVGSRDEEDYYDDEYTNDYRFLTAIVPVNITYLFPVSEKISIAPFAGINFKTHIIGEEKIEDEETYNLFDKDDMGKYNPQNETCDALRTKRAKIKTKRFSVSKRSVPLRRFPGHPFSKKFRPGFAGGWGCPGSVFE